MRPTFTAFARTVALACIGGCAGAEPAPQAPAAPPPAASSAPASAPALAAPAAETAPAPKPLVELIAQTLQDIRDAFNAHDAKKVASFYTEDCVAGTFAGPDAHGRDEVVGALQRMFDAFGDVKSAPIRRWVKGNVVVSEIAWTATMTGDFMGIKASRKPVGLVGLRVMRVNDAGLVKELHEYADDAGLLAQMKGKKNAPAVPILPSNTLEMHVAKGTPDEDQLASWGKGLDETFGKGDPKAVVAAMADDADYWTNLGGPALKGKKDLEKGLVAWFKAFPDQKWSSTEAWGIDGFAIVEHTMSGTQKGALGALPASGKAVSGWHWVDILQPGANLAASPAEASAPNPDRTVQHGWGFTNVIEMMQQTGALKQPAEKIAGLGHGPDQPRGPNVAPAAKTEPAPKKK